LRIEATGLSSGSIPHNPETYPLKIGTEKYHIVYISLYHTILIQRLSPDIYESLHLTFYEKIISLIVHIKKTNQPCVLPKNAEILFLRHHIFQ